MRKSLQIFMILSLSLWHASAFGNGLTLSNLSRDSLNQTVSFDIDWKNSWRLDGVSTPLNWDAAWVFVKFIPCNASATMAWTHGSLSTVLSNHTFGAQLEPVLSDGSAVGIDTDALGVMLRRSSTGLFGNAGPSRITLQVTNMATNVAYHLRVIGIEMVYVPQGAFDIGGIAYSNAFSANTSVLDPTPSAITSEAPVSIVSHAGSQNANVSLDMDFPKGYEAFHLMKYEITSGQYATFLNTLALISQYNRYPANAGTNRNTLAITGSNPLSVFGALRPDRAQNFLGWDDVAAYLDWAALRPITELEYEKACRGLSSSLFDEYAWGSTNIYELTGITAPEDGAEVPGTLPANANYIFNLFSTGDGGYGPVRAGIFALPSATTREQSGASYYGIMELSGNVAEPCVAVSDETSVSGTVNFDRSWGDGVLDANSAANMATWPTSLSGGIIQRGGSWENTSSSLRLADRSMLGWGGFRDRASGGRGGR